MGIVWWMRALFRRFEAFSEAGIYAAGQKNRSFSNTDNKKWIQIQFVIEDIRYLGIRVLYRPSGDFF
jgi:hypothetical protein